LTEDNVTVRLMLSSGNEAGELATNVAERFRPGLVLVLVLVLALVGVADKVDEDGAAGASSKQPPLAASCTELME
jgi:hypothetical protein